jgi:catechol 2,3-dioxygenase-like lactoylglutathione lyase family enzyme
MERALAFYRDALGFTVNSQPNFVNDAVLVLEGTLRAKARTAQTMPPGSNNMWVIWEFTDIERTRRAPAPQDPGASAISLEVENLPALLARLASGGVAVETAAPVDLGGGHRGALVRSPDGLLVELVD